MADHGRIEGERVFCHECSNEWDRNHGGLECPRCHSEFTEIRDNSPAPTPGADFGQHTPITSPEHPLHDLHDHNPWEHTGFPDPDEGDINTVRFNTRSGNGTISFTTYTTRRGPFGPRMNGPTTPGIEEDFASMLENIMGIPSQNRPRSNDPFPPPNGMGFFGGPPRRDGRSPDQTEMLHAPFAPMFSAIFSTIHNFPPPQHNPGGHGPQPMQPNPLILLRQLLNPQNAAHGDAVFTQEALDRVISQLMEQNAGSTAPGPASDAAISSLSKRPVDESMLDSDGKAECSICMEGVQLGEEVTFLPCNHWFHGPCVTAWLKEHDTCPHCRRGIMKQPDQPGANQGGGGQPAAGGSNNFASSSRGQSSSMFTTSAQDGSRGLPGSMPESPSEGRRTDSYYEQRQRSYATRQQSRTDSGRGSGNSGGGVTSWIRNHNPFSSGSA